MASEYDPTRLGEVAAFLANYYSGAEHEQLWEIVAVLLEENQRLRIKATYERQGRNE